MSPKAFLTLVTICGCLATACGPTPAAVAPVTRSSDSVQHLGDPLATNSTPVLAASGRWVVMVWTVTGRDRTNVYAATSDDGGARFGAVVRVNDMDGEAHVYGEDPPRVAVSATDRTAPPVIVVTWPSDRSKQLGLRSARSTDGGRTFSSSASIGDDTIVGERGFQSVTVGDDRVVRAAWLDGRRDEGAPHHMYAGMDWDPMHLMYASSRVDEPWSVESRVASNVCGCCKTAIATGRDGSVYVAFRNIYPGNLRDISFARSRDGRTFSAPVRVSEDHWKLEGCPDDGPTMAVDLAGTIHIVWPTLVDGTEPAIRLFHASTRDGLTFTPRETIDTLGTPKPSHPQMTLDGCGGLALVWDEAEGNVRRAVMRRLSPLASGDVQVSPSHVISDTSSAVYPVIAATDDGLVAAWTEIGATDDRASVAVRRIGLDQACSERPTEPTR